MKKFLCLLLLAAPSFANTFKVDLPATASATAGNKFELVISASCNAGHLNYVKGTLEYDSTKLELLGFEALATTTFFDENLDLPFGVCGSGVNENGLFQSINTNGFPTGSVDIAKAVFRCLSGSWCSTVVKWDCFCGSGLAHIELDSESPTDAVFNRCDADLAVVDCTVSKTCKAVTLTVAPGTWGVVKELYR
jgi:hypothetical protein